MLEPKWEQRGKLLIGDVAVYLYWDYMEDVIDDGVFSLGAGWYVVYAYRSNGRFRSWLLSGRLRRVMRCCRGTVAKELMGRADKVIDIGVTAATGVITIDGKPVPRISQHRWYLSNLRISN